MKYLFINSVFGVRSTGKIIDDQCHKLQNEGNTCVAAYGRETRIDSDIKLLKIGNSADYKIHALLARLFDLNGLCSRQATKKFLVEVEKYDPDVIWLHNLHGYYINIELLFNWIKEHPKIKVYWTLHDCWAFTGHCAYFTVAKCNQWKNGCKRCPQLKAYPKTIGLDHSMRNFRRKKNAFTGVNDLTLITPSKWLADLTRESYLSEYSVEVVNNTINLSVFKPTDSLFRDEYDLKDKYIVLGVAVGWEETKGFPDILELRKALSNQYVIVLVGSIIDKKAILPKGIISIERTSDQSELAKIYTAADVFVNPTHQDNYPTVNLEAAACGTPVITYNVGGSPESALKENVIPENNIEMMASRIREICENEIRK